METQKFNDLLREKTEELDRIIKEFLPVEEGLQKTVIQAMNYSVLAGGKRLRPMLMLESYRMCGGEGCEIEPFLAAIEMIHTYSLVHDDLPAMDNDEYRRGRETTWKVYGETMGILAGDGLLNLAFETALQAFGRVNQADPKAMSRVAGALEVLARKAGIYGMIGGQTVDIEAETQESPVTGEELLFIHQYKTAALIQASLTIGAILAGASPEQVQALEKCGEDLGVAFQIQDDILDVVGDSKELGKPVGSDQENHKQTYVTLHGLEQSKEDVALFSKEAVELLKNFKGEHEFLEQLIITLIHRRK
ncbi:MAG: polyprenyl synthetase family protein [Acetatifactor sp.]|nr:polyprenyl synthetase family protein [Acetatifactor sp.]